LTPGVQPVIKIHWTLSGLVVPSVCYLFFCFIPFPSPCGAQSSPYLFFRSPAFFLPPPPPPPPPPGFFCEFSPLWVFFLAGRRRLFGSPVRFCGLDLSRPPPPALPPPLPPPPHPPLSRPFFDVVCSPCFDFDLSPRFFRLTPLLTVCPHMTSPQTDLFVCCAYVRPRC